VGRSSGNDRNEVKRAATGKTSQIVKRCKIYILIKCVHDTVGIQLFARRDLFKDNKQTTQTTSGRVRRTSICV
jgi:hypothetical protein